MHVYGFNFTFSILTVVKSTVIKMDYRAIQDQTNPSGSSRGHLLAAIPPCQICEAQEKMELSPRLKMRKKIGAYSF